jgi:DNA repair exonuclease SbcCD ATPase subunit
MSDTENTEKIELNEVMLAMDVVDTLRHQQSLVDRELGTDDRDQALIAKVRKIYADQGLAVSDEVIASGVKALREERFSYTPPPKSFQLSLAHLYVNRGRWAKRGAVLVVALLAVYLVYQFFVVAPQRRSRQEAVQTINLRIDRQRDQISVTKERLVRISQSLTKAKEAGSQQASAAARELVDRAARDMAAAQEKIQALEKLEITSHVDINQGADIAATVTDRLDKRKELMADLSGHLNNAEKAATALDELKILPEKLKDQRDRALAESRQNEARRQAEKLYNDALTALGRGDVAAAQNGYALLQQLYDQLVQEYELRIVSREGSPSGVWRVPQNNPNARNYYVIVEAITTDGKRLTASIISEEDGKTHTVKQWGLRVSASVFEQIKRDKTDDGIISNNVFGQKKRGYLQPQYLIPTTGGAITQW